MRLTRVHVDATLTHGAELALPESATAHLTRVLRLRAGDACVLFDGHGQEADAVLLEIGKRGARVRVEALRSPDNESPLAITLLQGVARGEKMDLILQKATELGVAAVIPVFSERSEVKLHGTRGEKRLQHWQGVVVAACEQSGRAVVPAVAPPLALQPALTTLPGATRLLLDPFAERTCLDALPLGTSAVVLAVGPEGGWSPRDRTLLQEAGFEGVRLGPRVLRTETAGLAAIAVLQAIHGDLR